MGRFKWIITFCFIAILGNLFSACNNVKNEVKNTEDTTYIEDTMHTEDVVDTEISYVETNSCFRVKNSSDIDKTLSDGEIMDWKKWDRIENHILLKESIDIYNADKGKVGYTKPNIKAVYVAADGEWSHLAIGESGYSVYARTDELLAVMEEVETENTEMSNHKTDNASPKEDSEEPTYTVTDLDKTMYAKQSVNLRSGPSTDYEKVGSLNTNDEVCVTGQADTGWYRISYNGGVAFVSNNYLSDTKVEIISPDDANEDENDSEEEYTPPTDDDIIYIPEEPTYNYTVDEVISIVRSTLESNGFMWYPDVFPNSEYGPSGGMGWGMEYVPMNDPYTYANSMVEGAVYWGYNLYYLEYQSTENGYVVLVSYWGTLPQ